jgi:hypothetical protein
MVAQPHYHVVTPAGTAGFCQIQHFDLLPKEVSDLPKNSAENTGF